MKRRRPASNDEYVFAKSRYYSTVLRWGDFSEKRRLCVSATASLAIGIAAICIIGFALCSCASSSMTLTKDPELAREEQGDAVAPEFEQSVDGADASLSEVSSTGAPKPFWGVWVYASKDYDSALAFMEGENLASGEPRVFQTSEWSNLNSDPWYAVAYATADDERSAIELCEKAKQEGFADAYVKYSGDYAAGGDEDTVVVAEGRLARIALPGSTSLLMDFDTSDQYVISAKRGDVALFSLRSPSASQKKSPDERKKRVYSLGYATDGYAAFDIQLELYYVNAEGTGNVHWNDTAAIDLAIDKLLGLSAEELLAGIQLRDMGPADVAGDPDPEVKWRSPKELSLVGDDAG